LSVRNLSNIAHTRDCIALNQCSEPVEKRANLKSVPRQVLSLRAADFRQHGSIDSRARGTRCQDNRIHQGDQAGADRWQRGQGDHDV